MDYESKVSFLLSKKKELQDERSDLETMIEHLDEEMADLLEKHRATLVNYLGEDEETWLRDELTVVGTILCGENVIFGGLSLRHEDPDTMHTSGYFGPEHSTKYSIDMKVSICTEFKASLSCTVVIKTKTPRIEDIVREMFKSSEDSYDPDPLRREWTINWDYYQAIDLVNPYIHPNRT